MARSNLSAKQIQSMLNQLRQGRSQRNSPVLFGDDPDWFDEPTFDASNVNDWIEAVKEIESMFPVDAKTAPKSVRLEIKRMFDCGEIQGTWTQGRTTHQVFLSIDQDPSPAGCNCDRSSGSEPCDHAYQFARGVPDLLRNDRELRDKISRRDLDPGKPSRELFKPNQSQVALAELKQLLSNNRDLINQADQNDDLLTRRENHQAQGRILWNLDLDDGYLSIKPKLQVPRKRGSGFTKGKKVSLERLCQDRSLPLSPSDQCVVAAIKQERDHYYYGPQHVLDPIEAIQCLVGCDNVAFNDKPLTVRSCPNYLVIGSVDQKYRVMFTDDKCKTIYTRSWGNQNGFIRLDQETNELLISQTDSTEVELIKSLLKLPAVDEEHREELTQHLASLQSRLSIMLPNSIAGSLLLYDVRPAILLRSQTNGTLDFGIRIRDAAGVLRKPLSGPMVVASERDGRKVQLLRSAERESEQIDQLLTHWQLTIDRSDWFGTIDDFGIALRLIEQLQSPDSQVEVLWDRTCEKPITVLGNLSSNNVKVDITNKRNWFGITGECNFGEHSMSLNDLIQGLPGEGEQGIGDYIKLADGQWARISEGLRKRLKRLQEATHLDRNTLKLDATAAPAIRELIDSDVSIKASRAWEKCIKRLANAEKLQPTVPANLDATLRDYQIDGYKWLRKLAEWGVGGILADDMGLGKTLQTLAVLLDRSAEGPALVIAPTSVGFNWAREAQRFASDLDVHLYRETERSDFLPSVGPGTLVICSYGLALRDAEALAGVAWSTMVLDEAQAIKNSRSKTSKAIAGIDADWTVALTGTPVENHLGELWSLFHVVSPGVFGGWESFRKRYAAPIEKQNDDNARKSLANRLQPFVLRRTKSEVLTELPPRTEMNLYVDLSPAERAEYETVRLAAIGEIESIESLPQVQDQRFKILALMTRLRQIACHAGLVNKQWTGSSAKLDQLCETLESLREEGHRALIFSQFTEHLALIRAALEQRGFSYEYLDGSTPAKRRQEAVDEFQNGSADVFLISLKAGGTGLNLTAADYVIHMDPWWNPAVEDQATDRAHRMGQDKPVMVYRIVARGTIEEEILALHDSKRDLVAGVMQGTQAAAKLSNEDLIRMLRG
ncbi:DEAD/DEAH box helicase [Stieleria sp. TO1_6]|uniref:DEAD/DEAH box helicase n=1 Tax=Stieleria tagensis TaxID=2956795 RepID=UPI00209ADE2A|nr:DEAD/DEAH box helicase [Stieleria tagensis]MCO8122664.1 DEAD/DEAH box helicase [Stieleria tagensis]